MIDVNVHPTKQEIRFKDEQSAFKAVLGAIQKALSETQLVENIFVPKYDEKNKSQFTSYNSSTDSLSKIFEQMSVYDLDKNTGEIQYDEKNANNDDDKNSESKEEGRSLEEKEENEKKRFFTYKDMLKHQQENKEETSMNPAKLELLKKIHR